MTNEELRQKVKRLEEEIKDLKVKLEEERFLPYVPYEVEVPEDINDYVYINNIGNIYGLNTFTIVEYEKIYKRGLTFKSVEEAKQFDKERILLFKLHKWAEEYNGDWPHNLNDLDGEKYIIRYDYEDNQFEYVFSYCHNDFSKLPIFNSEEIAKQFIEEFGEEIKEVLC